MKYRAYRKDFFMEIKNTYNRFVSILCIVLLGVAFYTGIRSAGPDMKLSVDKLYDDNKIYDLKIYSVSGITQEDIENISDIDGVENVVGSYSYDMIEDGEHQKHVVKLVSKTEGINEVHITSGRNVESEKECIVDESFFKSNDYELGDKINIKSGSDIPAEYIFNHCEYEIVGTYINPIYLKSDHGDTTIGNGKIDGIVMIMPQSFILPAYTEANVRVEGADKELCYSDEYEDKVLNVSDRISSKDEKYIVTARNYIQSYSEFEMDAERIDKIGDIIPVIFYIIAALVSLTTMTRMVDEQRTLIGTYKALGYGKGRIAMRYIYYAILATMGGSLIGGAVGSYLLPRVIINAYKMLYPNLYTTVTKLNILQCGTAVFLSALCVVGATIFAGIKSLRSSAAELMRPAAPKNGKRILLERFGIIWRHMSFNWKSVARNIARYKKRIFMTIFGICGCMSLLITGFGIKDSIKSIVDKQYTTLHKYDITAKYENPVSVSETAELNESFENNKNIKSYIDIYSLTTMASNGKKNISSYIYVTDDQDKLQDFISFGEGKDVPELTDEGVVITKKLSILLKLNRGDELILSGANGENEHRVKIIGIAENYVFHYIYMTDVLYEKVFESEYKYNQTFIVQKNPDEDMSEELLKDDRIASVSTIGSLRQNFDYMLLGLDIIIVVIIVAAGGLAFVVLYNLNNINICERIRELATLKVLGFYNKEVSAYIFRENIILTIVGILTGYVCGNFLHKFVISTVEVDMVMFGRQAKPLSYLLATLITIVFSIIINITMHFKLKKIDMTTSLKSVE